MEQNYCTTIINNWSNNLFEYPKKIQHNSFPKKASLAYYSAAYDLINIGDILIPWDYFKERKSRKY